MNTILLLCFTTLVLGNQDVKDYLETVAKFGADPLVIDQKPGTLGSSEDEPEGENDHYAAKIISAQMVDKTHFLAFREFKREVDFINSHIEIPFEAEINKFSFLTEAERKLYTGINVSALYQRDLEEVKSRPMKSWKRRYTRDADDDDIPEALDWDKEGAVTPVRAQGNCGSCWAFAGVSSLETNYFIHTGDKVQFSDQEVIDCAFESRAGKDGCTGSPLNGAFLYVKRSERLAFRQDTGYHSKDRVCRYDSHRNAFTKMKLTNIKRFTDDDGLLEVLLSGSVAAAINVPTSFYMYKRGNFEDQHNCGLVPQHAVNVVGFGPNHWRLRNSWGPEWGDRGYAKFSRSVVNNCQVAKHVYYPVLECKDEATCQPHEKYRELCYNVEKDFWCNRNRRLCTLLPEGARYRPKSLRMQTQCRRTCGLC